MSANKLNVVVPLLEAAMLATILTGVLVLLVMLLARRSVPAAPDGDMDSRAVEAAEWGEAGRTLTAFLAR